MIDLFKREETSFTRAKLDILDSARTLDYLKADLGLLPHPYEPYNTIDPVEGGYYEAEGKIYVYKDGELKEYGD